MVLAQVTNRRNFYNISLSIILKKNIKEFHKMYNNPHYIDKLKSLIFYLNNNLKKNNFCIKFLISPQLLDLTDGQYENV